MISRNKIFQMLNFINMGYKIDKKFIYVPKSKIIINILNMMYNEGIIYNFLVLKKNIKLYLKYNKSLPIGLFYGISKPSWKKIYSYKELKRISKKCSFMCVSTTKGIINFNLIKYYRIGGELLFIIKK